MLDEKQIESYKKQGFLIVKNLMPISLLEEIKQDVKTAFFSAQNQKHTPCLKSDLEFNHCLFDLFKNNFPAYHGAAKLANHCASLHRVSLQEEIISAIRELGVKQPSICARPLMWFHAQQLATTERYHRLPAHQEWSNMQGSLNGIVAWCPLVTVSKEMGRLQIIPGSHLNGLLPFNSEIEKDYPFAIEEKYYDDEQFEEVDVEYGDCLFFSAFLIHRSGINTSDKVRWTVNFRYNDMAETSFIKRHYLNPFVFEASTELQDGFVPGSEALMKIFRNKENRK